MGKVYRDGTRAVEDFNLDVADGEFMVFVGPSGCGKTTALRMVAGLEDITEGEIRIGDRVVNRLDPRKRDVAMVFQNYALYPHMTVFENIAFALQVREAPSRRDQAPGRGGRADARARRPELEAQARRSSPAASASAWRWAARSCASRRCS